MKFKKSIVFFIIVLSPMFFFGQIKLSKEIQSSKIAQSEENSLYFIDFWATWCGPCIHASKYLESLQKQFPNDFYIVSLTQESPEVINRFMEKHKTGLAVAIDYQGETFTNNNISSLPYGVLYNAKGLKLWEGHAADLKDYNIREFLRNNKTKVSLSSFFKVHKYEEAVKEKVAEVKKDFTYIQNNDIESESTEIQVYDKANFLEIKGSLQDILSYSLKSYKEQIKLPDHLNKYYEMRFKKGSKEFYNQEKFILRALKLKKENEEKRGDVILLDVKIPNFWDTKQIDWGEDNPKYLIGDSDIKADNVTLGDVSYKLANLLEIPVLFLNSEIDEELHDWQIHYKYFKLMYSNFNDYGINIEKKRSVYIEHVYKSK